jgi:hypothetical protein
MYNQLSNQWCWMTGNSTNVARDDAVTGTLRVFDSSNLISGRQYHSGAIDLRTNRIYIYGGDVNVPSGRPRLSDVWMYDIPSVKWARVIAGSTSSMYPPVRGIAGGLLVALACVGPQHGWAAQERCSSDLDGQPVEHATRCGCCPLLH